MQLPAHVFHMAEETNWPLIEQHGLLPARDLLRQAFPHRVGLDALHRPEHTVLPNGVRIRDQRPIPERALAACLVEMSPSQWYELINAHVFFWLDPDRLNRQRAACTSRAQVVATVSTADLLSAHARDSYVTPFNIGYALRRPARRGLGTLVPYSSWQRSGWVSETEALDCASRSRTHPPAELLVRGSIPGFMRMVRKVVRLEPGERYLPSAA